MAGGASWKAMVHLKPGHVSPLPTHDRALLPSTVHFPGWEMREVAQFSQPQQGGTCSSCKSALPKQWQAAHALCWRSGCRRARASAPRLQSRQWSTPTPSRCRCAPAASCPASLRSTPGHGLARATRDTRLRAADSKRPHTRLTCSNPLSTIRAWGRMQRRARPAACSQSSVTCTLQRTTRYHAPIPDAHTVSFMQISYATSGGCTQARPPQGGAMLAAHQSGWPGS